jgi:hypothetical protein
MATPPSSPPPPSHGYYGGNLPPFPIPNAELIVYAFALLVVGIVAAAAESVPVAFWVEFAKWATAAYLVSRGIAKLGKVYENR